MAECISIITVTGGALQVELSPVSEGVTGDDDIILESGSAGGSLAAQANPADMAREDGNAAFAKGPGNYDAAISAYTRSLSLVSATSPSATATAQRVAAYSNRSLVYLKSKQYRAAADDATAALRLDGSHVKSWLRRASARNGLGQHVAALRDLQAALALEPGNRQALEEQRRTSELSRLAHNAAPEWNVPVRVDGGGIDDCVWPSNHNGGTISADKATTINQGTSDVTQLD